MVRTKADCSGVKVAAAKAPRKALGNPSSSNSFSSPNRPGKNEKYSGGNSYNPQPTPDWQKNISNFFTVVKENKENEDANKVEEMDQETETKKTTKNGGKGSKSKKQKCIESDSE